MCCISKKTTFGGYPNKHKMDYSNERWMPVKKWNGKYLISDHGRFKSIGGKYKKIHPDGYTTLGYFDTGGYKSICMRRPKKREYTRIHVLVAEHFIESPKRYECVNHLDGNKLNNHYLNLEKTTNRKNIQHAVEIGIFNIKGEKHPSVKLTEIQVIEMRRLRKEHKMTHEAIAAKFGVCRRQAGDVINGVNWGWLKDGL